MSAAYSPQDSISVVKGVGPATVSKLAKLEIETVGDLLHHFPARYLDFTHQTNIKDIRAEKPVSFLASISDIKTFYSKNKRLITQAIAKDKTGQIILTWFNNPYLKRNIVDGEIYSIAGKPSFFGPKLTLISPVFELGNSFGLHTKGLIPIYPQTAGLNSRWIRKTVHELLPQTKLNDPLTSDLLDPLALPNLTTSVSQIHFPADVPSRLSADKRLSFNEHLRINLHNRLEHLKLGKSISLKTDTQIDKQTAAKLPWTLTPDQKKSVHQLYEDFQNHDFTHRLIQGETGSGKTATLIFAANQCLAQNFSCAILAPTEVLARQHYETFQKYSLFPEQVILITATQKSSLSPRGAVYIGTHALFNSLPPDLNPPLAFVAIDEQHRFGVSQRDNLLLRSPLPHLINLSATPIPRTVALGLLGDISVSTIKHKPLNRLPTKTFVMSPSKFKESPPWLIKELENGNQIFVVCPHIHDRETDISSVENVALFYRKLIPNTFPVYTLHGKLSSQNRHTIITDFKTKGKGVLVATSLIEVGLDIPAANIMIIHSAERFGLAQLHQLRGRVGRGEGQGYCFLIPSSEDDVEIERLQLLKKYSSGLTLAKKDLRLRGAGEIFGLKQHGTLPTSLKYFWSKKLFLTAKKMARDLIDQNPAQANRIATELLTW